MYTGRETSRGTERGQTAGGFAVVHGPAGVHKTHSDAEMLQDLGAFTQFLEDQWAGDTPDVVHAHFWSAGVAAQLAARAQQIPTVQSLHSLAGTTGPDPARPGAQSRRRLEAIVTRGSTWLVASHTEEMRQASRMGRPRARISVVPCGVDTDVFSPDGVVAPRGERQRILAAGDVAAGRGYDTLIRSLSLIPNAELLIVGEIAAGGRARDGEASRLTALATRLGVVDRVRFYGRASHQEMPELLRSADVVACVPQQESFGLVALEAMACGVPVVASAVGGLTDTVIPDVTGRLVSPRKPRECAGALSELLTQPFTRSSLGAAGRDRACSRYSWDRIAFETIQVYRGLVPEAAQLSRSADGVSARVGASLN